MRISDWSSDVCSSDLEHATAAAAQRTHQDVPVVALHCPAGHFDLAVHEIAVVVGRGAQVGHGREVDALGHIGEQYLAVVGVDAVQTAVIGADIDGLGVPTGSASCRERVGQYG